MRALPIFVDVRGKPVIVLGEGQAAREKAAIVERAHGAVAPDEAADARLAIVAHDSEEETEAAVERLRARFVDHKERRAAIAAMLDEAFPDFF